MNKKNIFFLADSVVDLIGLYEKLKNFYEISWVIYNDDVLNELRKKKINPKNIILANHFGLLSFLHKKNILLKILKKFNFKFFKNLQKNILISAIREIDNKYKPNFWITDTGSILSKIKTHSPKCTFKHSVCYKNYYLNKNIFDYDHVFLPGQYHYNRIIKFWKNKKKDKDFDKLIVAGSLKISSYVNKKNLMKVEKERLLEKFNLSQNKETVLFAPSHDAYGFGSGRFLSKGFGNQFNSVRKISEFVNDDLNCNFILKLHHYQFNLLKNSELKKIENKKDNFLFKKSKYFDTEESEDVIRLADIIISDISGVGPIGAFLGKKVIFMDPYHEFNWHICDIESNYRPGFVCKNFDDLIAALKKMKGSDNLFKNEQKKFVNEIFFNHNIEATEEISKSLQKIIR